MYACPYVPAVFIQFNSAIFIQFNPAKFIQFNPAIFIQFIPAVFIQFNPAIFIQFNPAKFIQFNHAIFIQFNPAIYIQFNPAIYVQSCNIHLIWSEVDVSVGRTSAEGNFHRKSKYYKAVYGPTRNTPRRHICFCIYAYHFVFTLN